MPANMVLWKNYENLILSRQKKRQRWLSERLVRKGSCPRADLAPRVRVAQPLATQPLAAQPLAGPLVQGAAHVSTCPGRPRPGGRAGACGENARLGASRPGSWGCSTPDLLEIEQPARATVSHLQNERMQQKCAYDP